MRHQSASAVATLRLGSGVQLDRPSWPHSLPIKPISALEFDTTGKSNESICQLKFVPRGHFVSCLSGTRNEHSLKALCTRRRRPLLRHRDPGSTNGRDRSSACARGLLTILLFRGIVILVKSSVSKPFVIMQHPLVIDFQIKITKGKRLAAEQFK